MPCHLLVDVLFEPFFVVAPHERHIDFMSDFYIEELNIAIEFNGDVWHANPEIFNENDSPNPLNDKINSKDIWQKDKIRNEYIKSKGVYIIVVWEKEFKYNGIEKTTQELVEKIKSLSGGIF